MTDRAELLALCDDLEQLAAKATPGPWRAEQQKDRAGNSLGWVLNHSNGRIGWSWYATAVPNEGEEAPHQIGGANAHLIAACDPSTILKLIKAVRAASKGADV